MSLNKIDIVIMIALKAFNRSKGEVETFYRITGAAPMHLQYVYKALSGFIAKVGKFTFDNEPFSTSFFVI